jgi:hypothetical protein
MPPTLRRRRAPLISAEDAAGVRVVGALGRGPGRLACGLSALLKEIVVDAIGQTS